ncbi:DUF1003 domain-containing protein [bacterium]|nr:MAG: DUF1003 domain-containing protein [bacterium]
MERPLTKDPESPLASVVDRNIEALLAVKREAEERRTTQDRTVDAVTAFAGSIWCVYFHATLLVFWLLVNTGKLGIRPWDPYPFVMLAMAASVEAIFLSTFVLIGQNRQSIAADRRADLDVQINLLTEHEVTRLVNMVDAISRKLGIDPDLPDLEEIKRDVAPEKVVEEIDRRETVD